MEKVEKRRDHVQKPGCETRWAEQQPVRADDRIVELGVS